MASPAPRWSVSSRPLATFRPPALLVKLAGVNVAVPSCTVLLHSAELRPSRNCPSPSAGRRCMLDFDLNRCETFNSVAGDWLAVEPAWKSARRCWRPLLACGGCEAAQQNGGHGAISWVSRPTWTSAQISMLLSRPRRAPSPDVYDSALERSAKFEIPLGAALSLRFRHFRS